MSSSTSGRRRTTDRHYSAEDQALDQISKEAEERIQARRQARAEARAIRINEIERKQKEEEEKLNATQHGSSLDITKSSSLFSGSRRGSNDSTDTDASSKDGSKDPKDQVRELKNQLHELEDKYKAAMVTNAQLDNTKTSYMFQLELLKEQLEEQEETMIEVQREYKDKCRDFELLKRDFESTKLEVNSLKQIMDIKDKLLQESGLVIVSSEEGEFSLKKCTDMAEVSLTSSTALISAEAANLLKRAGEGTLDDKLKKILAEQKELQEENKALNAKLEEERSKKDSSKTKVNTTNGPEMGELYELQKEASKQIHEYKLKLQKSEQEVTNLDGTVTRLETQIKHLKYEFEESQRSEDELKTERRRLQREMRECQNQIDELQTQNQRLSNRLDKIKQSRLNP